MTSMPSRRVLVCSYYAPQFDRDSGSRRLFHFIELLLHAGWSVTFLGYVGGEPRYQQVLRRRGVLVSDLSDPGHKDLVSAGQFDMALIAYWPVAEHFLPLIRQFSPTTRVIVDSVDVHFLRHARRLFGVSDSGHIPHLLDARHGDEIVAELNTYAAADVVLTVSDTEAALLGTFLQSATPVYSVPDGEVVTNAPAGPDERRGVLFVGSFRHTPNVGAVMHLCREIVPQLDSVLAADHPVYVVGDGLTESVRRHGEGNANIRMVGWVPDIAPYLARCRVSVVPLLYGAGTKRKTVQSLLAGLPVVTTSVGAEGLDLENGRHAFVEDEPRRFAEAVNVLLGDDDTWRRMASEGHRHASSCHGLGVISNRLLTSLRTALVMEPKPRRWEPDLSRLDARARSQWMDQVLDSLEAMLKFFVPSGSHVLVVTGGDERMLRLSGVDTETFPSPNDFTASSDSQALVEELERRRRQGTYLLVPESARWWLDGHPALRDYLEREFSREADWTGAGVLVNLARNTTRSSPPLGRDRVLGPPILKGDAVSATAPAARLIAFYLPQFHPIPENNTWWEEGFTEWTNVTKAEPLFSGHYQPRFPADLGFYDLRLPAVREQQAALAKEHGIFGFCYYHYWFHGRRLLERPFDEVLALGRPDLPFVLCWANEPWSRRWHGRPEDVLQPQSYSPEDDLAHIRWLIPALTDPRALTVDGKPVFIVYQARDLPDPAATVERWRSEVAKVGRELHLLAVETGWDEGWDATKVGFDAKVLFQPQFTTLTRVPRLAVGAESLRVFSYDDALELLAREPAAAYPTYETVCPGWDNTPRAGTNGWLLHGSTPEAYERWVTAAVERASAKPPEYRLVFVNAWNEWAEGAHLEPDRRHGAAYLEATRRAVLEPRCATPSIRAGEPVKVEMT